MPVDYSKWDALELSDDSDIEVHPNVDKRSFIRAKQNQIHAERQQRRHQIETLKYERVVNDGLMKRISSLLESLRAHAADAERKNPGEVAFAAVMESASRMRPEEDQPPARPAGVHGEEDKLPTYSKMMATLLDQVNKTLDERKVGQDGRYGAMVEEVGEHLEKVQGLQKDLSKKLDELEREEGRKITSEGIHTGFDSSFVAKSKSGETKKGPSGQVELLNPGFAGSGQPSQPAAGAGTAAGNDDDDDDDDDVEIEASPAAKHFATIKPGDYSASLSFLGKNPDILTERETDGLLILAFNAQLEGRDDEARQCVHQALLLQYCRALGRDGVQLFFKRITTKGHQAQDVFHKDVQDTWTKIRTRAREMNAQRAQGGASSAEGVEQIQLHAVDPGTEIRIRIPPAGGGAEEEEEEGDRAGREIFEAFKPELKTALETGSLEEVNKVLGRMTVEEAEDVVGKLGEAGILSVEEQIIDATTAEGQQQLKDMEQQAAEEAKTEDPE